MITRRVQQRTLWDEHQNLAHTCGSTAAIYKRKLKNINFHNWPIQKVGTNHFTVGNKALQRVV